MAEECILEVIGAVKHRWQGVKIPGDESSGSIQGSGEESDEEDGLE